MGQSVRPTRRIIVDDGPTDGTSKILDKGYEREHDWIEVVRREDRGTRRAGPGVIGAFYGGPEMIDPHD